MDMSEARVRRRGFVVIHTDPSVDDELDSAEGLTLRVRVNASRLHQRPAVTSSRATGSRTLRGASHTSSMRSLDVSSFDGDPIRSMSGTGIRQRSHSHR